MNQPRYLQMVRTNRFELVYKRWKERKLTQAGAGERLEMSERTFRRYVVRYEEEGKQGLGDRRLGKPSPRRASRQEVSSLVALYRDCYPNRNIRHFYEVYEERHGALHNLKNSRLQLGEEVFAGCGGGSEGQASGAAPGAQGAQEAGGGDDTPGRKHAQMDLREDVGSGCNDG